MPELARRCLLNFALLQPVIAINFTPCADEVNALVIDIGGYQCKAGYAGEDAPKVVFGTVRMRPLPT